MMSPAPRYPGEFGDAGLRMTAEEFVALGETPERCELLNGVVVMSPSPTPRHRLVLAELVGQAMSWKQSRAGARVFGDGSAGGEREGV